MPSAPNWVAGTEDRDDAPRFCDASFSGGPVWLVQYVANNLDHNYVCESATPAPTPAPVETSEAKHPDLSWPSAKNRVNIFDRIRGAAGLAGKVGDPVDAAVPAKSGSSERLARSDGLSGPSIRGASSSGTRSGRLCADVSVEPIKSPLPRRAPFGSGRRRVVFWSAVGSLARAPRSFS